MAGRRGVEASRRSARAHAAAWRQLRGSYRGVYDAAVRELTPQLGSRAAHDRARRRVIDRYREEYDELVLVQKRLEGITPRPAKPPTPRRREAGRDGPGEG